jgi:RimJ/RimL family protein N-acetyltransferase
MSLSFVQIEKSESEILADWLSSDSWPYFLGSNPKKEEILIRIEDGDFFGDGEQNFWILNSEKEYIGLIEIYQLDDLAPMFSIRFKTPHRGKGYGKPTLEWLTKYIFENFPDKRRIEAQTREDNIPMRKLFNKCLFLKEAYFRFASPTENGERVASIAYGILREDWLSGKLTRVPWKEDSFFSNDIS